jgi:hypothetical protein
MRARRALQNAGREATAVRSAVAVGGEGKARQGGASTVSDWCLMCSEGVDNQVAREGRGMCLAKQAAGIETSDEQAAASVLGMGEGREKKWIARPGRRDGVRLVRWRRVV